MTENVAIEVFVNGLTLCVDSVLEITELTALRYHRIKSYIPRVWRNFLDFLTMKGNADQLGTKPLFSIAKVCETSIVIGASHADAIVVFVKGNGWRNDNVKAFCVQ